MSVKLGTLTRALALAAVALAGSGCVAANPAPAIAAEAGGMAASQEAARSDQPGPSAPTPGLRYVFSVNATVDPAIEQGDIDGGKTRYIPITGGEVYGEALHGTLLNGGGDWQTIRQDGLTDIEARYFLKLDDGTIVEVHSPGVRTASVEVIDKIANGIPVDHDSYYFRTTPSFRVAGEKYAWMERHVFVARGVRFPDKVIIDYYLVE